MTRSNTDPSSLTVFAVVLIYSLATIFAVASIYQRYRHSQQHRSVSVNGICSSIDLFISNILRSSSQQFAAVRNSIDLSTLTVFAVVLIYPPTVFFAAA